MSPRKRRRLTEAEFADVRKRAHRYLTSPDTPRREARACGCSATASPAPRDLDWARVRDASPEALARIDLYLRSRGF